MASGIVFSEYAEMGPNLLNSTDHKIQANFRVAPIHVTVANTLRRQVLAAVATVGFKTEPPESSDVHITENTTPLVNEMLMHRIGMIPIAIADPSTFNPDDYEFRLNIENVGKSLVSVSASDFVVAKTATPTEPETILETKDFFPPDPITGMTPLITVLRPRYNMDSPTEKLTIRARASVGTGRNNMRYSSVAQCSYEYTADNDEARQNEMFNTWLANSKKVPDSTKISPERLGELRRQFDCLEVQRCYLMNEKGEPYDFTFHLESVGVFSVPTIIHRALKSCEDLVTPYTSMDTDLPDSVTFSVPANRMTVGGTFEFLFKNEDHTLGNLLQTYLIERHIESTELPRITYAGYKIPHPLKAEMALIVTPIDGDPLTARKAIANVCKFLKLYFADVGDAWAKTPKTGQAAAPLAIEAPTVTVAAAKTRARTKK
jgi:DNA-directed RNA polymerase subunit L